MLEVELCPHPAESYKIGSLGWALIHMAAVLVIRTLDRCTRHGKVEAEVWWVIYKTRSISDGLLPAAWV